MRELFAEYGLSLVEMLGGVFAVKLIQVAFYAINSPLKEVVVNYVNNLVR